MKPVKLFLERWGLHTFLLPLFFVTHNYLQYYGLVSTSIAIKLCLLIILCVAVLSVLVLAIIKNTNKAFQLTTLLSFLILFFGGVKDFLGLTLHSTFLAKYSILLPLLAVVIVFVSRIIIKKNDLRKLNLFQNILLLVFLVIDIGRIVVFDHSLLSKNLLVKNKLPAVINSTSLSTKPDIYFLVFDSYPGTTFLKEFMNYDNTPFNQGLEELGFYVVKNSRSNYNRTVFSIASTLNFEHLRNIRSHDIISSKDYANACLTIKESIVPKFFLLQNYSFFNLSIFDIGINKPIRRETFLTAPEQDILLHNTLLQRIKNDLLWNLLEGKYASPIIQKIFVKNKEERQREFLQKNEFNKMVLDSLSKVSFHQQNSPKFVYAHLYLPHPPFFYNEDGQKNNLDYILSAPSLKNKNLFLSYLRYTNKKIMGIIKTIQEASENKSVIIVQSDHGFRDFEGGPNYPETFFTNYSAFYFPDKDYSTLYDKLTNVNTFPIILNKYFKTNLKRENDSLVFLPY